MLNSYIKCVRVGRCVGAVEVKVRLTRSVHLRGDAEKNWPSVRRQHLLDFSEEGFTVKARGGVGDSGHPRFSLHTCHSHSQKSLENYEGICLSVVDYKMTEKRSSPL